MRIFFFFLVILLFASCNQKKDGNTESEVNNLQDEIWAEQLESSANLIRPDDWSESDWNSVSKGIDRNKIFNSVTEAVLSGKQKAYNYISDEELTIEDVKSIIYKTDSIQVIDTINNLVTYQLINKSVTQNDLTHIRTREKWIFDTENFKLKKEVTSIGFFTNVYDQNGNFRGNGALFYVKLLDH